MNRLYAITLTLAVFTIASAQAYAQILSVEFDWTPQPGFSQYTAMFLYSGGTTANGIFTPSGLITYSFGSPFGTITPATHYPGFGFLTDTPYGPSFQTQGAIEPINYPGNPISPPNQEFEGNNLDMLFQGQTETIAYFDTKLEPHINLTGTWTETIVTAPDAANSLALLGIALAALGVFHALRRARAARS